MEITESLQTRAEQLQKDSHKYISEIFNKTEAEIKGFDAIKSLINGNHVKYDSILASWIYTKLAEIELRIEKLEKQKQIDDQFKALGL